MRITLFDYGAGNLHSLAKALSVPDAELVIETDPLRALETDLLVLPGVGAFGVAAERLAHAREALRQALQKGLPTLGVCLGMQLLFDSSEEGPGAGIGFFSGRVTRLRARRVPHIGWSELEGSVPLRWAYYAHSYACRPERTDEVIAWTTHEGDCFPAVVRRGRVLAVQFHPEKSSGAGLAFVRSFLREVWR